MATKIGRNDSCPCGSGRKYKRCCLDEDQRRERDARTAEQADDAEFAEWSDAIDADSEAVQALIEAQRLDEAEGAARDMIAKYPEVHDGLDCLGMVYEAREQPQQAAECYRRIIRFLQAGPVEEDAELVAIFRELIEKLDPAPPAA